MTIQVFCRDCGVDVSADAAEFRELAAAHASAKGMTGAECAERFIAEFGFRCKLCEHAHRQAEAARGSWLARASLMLEQCQPDETVAILPMDGLTITKRG